MCTYNGLGDRLTQNGTQYVLDLNAGLTQVLSDGENSYMYGLGRISQTNTMTEYFLGDALGSVRQLSMTDGEITLAQNYDPYGTVTYTAGTSSTPYGFTGETTDANGLVYLRARYYNPADARFMSRDTWAGRANNPMSYNKWQYVYSNPANFTDPTGRLPYGPPYLSKKPCNEHGGKNNRYCILNEGGYIDTSHFRGGKEKAREIIRKLENAKSISNDLISLSRSIIVSDLEVEYITRIPANIDNGTMISVSLGIFLDFEYQFENIQLIDPRCAWNMVACSSFSNEDLPSDYLGFVDFVTKNKDFDDIISDLGGGWASRYKPSEYLSHPYDLMRCPDGICGENTSRNTDCTLKVFDPETKTFRNNPWPSSHPYMNIRPSGFGVYWGRSIFDFKQDLVPVS